MEQLNRFELNAEILKKISDSNLFEYLGLPLDSELSFKIDFTTNQIVFILEIPKPVDTEAVREKILSQFPDLDFKLKVEYNFKTFTYIVDFIETIFKPFVQYTSKDNSSVDIFNLGQIGKDIELKLRLTTV